MLKSRIVKNSGLKDSAYIVGESVQRRISASVIYPSINLNGHGFFVIFPASCVNNRHILSLGMPLVCAAWIPLDSKGAQQETTLFHGGTSFTFYFPATRGLKATGITSPWLSTHASLVSLSDRQTILWFTNPPLAQQNDSHSEYMLPVSQRLNYPGNSLPPGLQLILLSTFVITGAIPPINIDHSQKQSRPEMHFFLSGTSTRPGEQNRSYFHWPG